MMDLAMQRMMGGSAPPSQTTQPLPGGGMIPPSGPPASGPPGLGSFLFGGQGGGPTSPFAPVPGVQPPPPPGAGPVPPGGPISTPNVPLTGPGDAPSGSVRTGRAKTAQAGPADYQGVRGFADQAYQQARRNIDPAQEQQSRRMEQDLINKGIDPSSAQGKAMLDQQNRNFADQDNAANFQALQFGQDIQNQMFGQSAQNAQMQNQMTQANMQADIARSGQDIQRYGMDQQFALGQGNQAIQQQGMAQQYELGKAGQALQQYGMDQQYNLGQSGQNLQRYGMDQQYGLGMGNLDMQRQGQDFNQMLGLEGMDFRNRAYNDSRGDYQDSLTMALMGITPVPGVNPFDPSGLAGTQIGASSGGGLLTGLGG